MIKDIKKYIQRFFLETKEKHPSVENNVLKSCLVYQWLYHKHFKKYLSVNEILEINNYDIGLIGPNRGLLQYFLESTLGNFQIFHTHSILHDAFGRFYINHHLDRGYLYSIRGAGLAKW